MRSVESQFFNEKITNGSHYMATQQSSENVDLDTKCIPLSTAESGGNRIVTVMHHSGFTTSQISRQVSVTAKSQISSDAVAWGDELLSSGMGISGDLMEEDRRLAAALVAVHYAQGRPVGLQEVNNITKVPPDRNEVEAPTNILDNEMRLFTQSQPQMVVPTLPTLPTMPSLKSAQEHVWFQPKHEDFDKNSFKNKAIMNSMPLDHSNIELDISAQNKSNKKSLPHKKRISRRLKRSTPLPQHMTLVECPQQDEQILPDHFVQNAQDNALTQQIRPSFICQICGDFYDMDQLKFYQHLKQHYEPRGATILMDDSINPTHSGNGLVLDKMDSNSTIVEHGASLPESLVELSLEGTVPGKSVLYQPSDKDILYSSSDNSKELYNPLTMNKEELYQPPLYSCPRCTKTFRKQKACEAHIREFHFKDIDAMSEFSEPEDLMEGIHVMVEIDDDYQEAGVLPHLTVENGHVHQGHLIMKQWFLRNSEMSETHTLSPQPLDQTSQIESPISHTEGDVQLSHVECPLCNHVLPGREAYDQHALDCHIHLKEEVLQRMIAVEERTAGQLTASHDEPEKTTIDTKVPTTRADKEKVSHKKWVCGVAECNREFRYRNSLMYHVLSHSGKKPFPCSDCDKSFYTTGALKVHKRLHSGDKPYKCDVCGRDFRQWGDLKYHKASLHSTQKLHQCEYCGKDFARKYSLNVHRRIHTGEKNYKCDFCPKAFRASSYLMFHRRIHTGEKPHTCLECGKCFTVKGDLRRHILMHKKWALIGDADKKATTKKARAVKKANKEMEQKKLKVNIADHSSTSSIDRGKILLITNEQACDESEKNIGVTGGVGKQHESLVKVNKKDTEDQTSVLADVPAMYVWPYAT